MASYTIHVIQEGYCRENGDGTFHADCSITLIKGRYNIIVDTGGPKSRQIVLDGLAKHGLGVEEITHVVGTHGHVDHIGNLNLFPAATFIVSHDVFNGKLYLSHDLPKAPFKIDDQIEVISTPGHTGSDISVIIQDTPKGITAVVGDLFECEADLTKDSLWREVSEDPTLQEKSRAAMLDMANFIIPGHGKGFCVQNNTSPSKTTQPEPDSAQSLPPIDLQSVELGLVKILSVMSDVAPQHLRETRLFLENLLDMNHKN